MLQSTAGCPPPRSGGPATAALGSPRGRGPRSSGANRQPCVRTGNGSVRCSREESASTRSRSRWRSPPAVTTPSEPPRERPADGPPVQLAGARRRKRVRDGPNSLLSAVLRPERRARLPRGRPAVPAVVRRSRRGAAGAPRCRGLLPALNRYDRCPWGASPRRTRPPSRQGSARPRGRASPHVGGVTRPGAAHSGPAASVPRPGRRPLSSRRARNESLHRPHSGRGDTRCSM